ncbi:hypothetical protein BGZ73_000989 [Actinomortierella ambigua]|nr:hypothetical protein BGZ73_000989 [Actinomortierella ambigua]
MKYASSHPDPSEESFAGVCPDCSSRQVIPSNESGYVCSACGFVLEQVLLLAEEEDPQYNLFFAMPDLANEETTILAQFSNRRFVAGDKILQSMRRYRHRFLLVRRLLEDVARSLGMTMGPDGDTERAFFLFKQAKEVMGWRFGLVCDGLAMACLFIASKERHRGFSLTEVAIKANQEPAKLGHVYKKATRALLDSGIITVDHPCFRTEKDPWFMLDRLIFLGHRNDSRGIDLAQLPTEYQAVLGVGMDDIEKIGRLRHIMALAAKCIAVILDSTQGDSRTPEATVAACVATAVQIKIKAGKVDDSFWNVMVDFFYANLRTAWRRRADLRMALQNIALQNPVLAPSAHRLKHSDKFAYFAEEALQFWEPSDDQLREKLHSFDQTASLAADESDSPVDEADWFTRLTPNVSILDKTCTDSVDGGVSPIRDEADQSTLQGQYPPSFVKAQKDREARVRQIQEAQRQLLSSDKDARPSYSCSLPLSSTADIQPKKLPSLKDQLAAVRVQWMKQLLAVKYKMPAELEDATDSMLEYWVEQANKSTSDHEKRTEEDLNSRDPSAKDMSNDEIMRYLRSPGEVEAARRILQPIYDEYEAEKRRKAIGKTVRKRAMPAVSPDTAQVKRRKPGSAETTSNTNVQAQSAHAVNRENGEDLASGAIPPRPRSSLINWAAIERLEREEAEAEARDPTPNGTGAAV